jgi:amino acid transporter
MQDAVSAGGAQLAIFGFLLLPLVWSLPEALVAAELATAFPENSGFVAWVTAAFGPFWGFQEVREFSTRSLNPPSLPLNPHLAPSGAFRRSVISPLRSLISQLAYFITRASWPE